MKIAIIADIHDNFHNLTMFLEQVKIHNPKKIIFLGDFINCGIAKILAGSKIPIIAIWGNNDGDKVAITKTALSHGSMLTVGYDTFDIITIEKRKIFLTHYPVLAKPMARSGDFDAVFYGHDHKSNIDKIGDCIIINPGEISAHKTSEASYAIYDTKTNSAEIIRLRDSLTTKTDHAKKAIKNISSGFSDSTHIY